MKSAIPSIEWIFGCRVATVAPSSACRYQPAELRSTRQMLPPSGPSSSRMSPYARGHSSDRLAMLLVGSTGRLTRRWSATPVGAGWLSAGVVGFFISLVGRGSAFYVRPLCVFLYEIGEFGLAMHINVAVVWLLVGWRPCISRNVILIPIVILGLPFNGGFLLWLC